MIQSIVTHYSQILYLQIHLLAAAAAAAKSLQSCPTLCDPIDGSPPGSPRPWDSPGKNTGVGCRFLLQCTKVKSEREAAQSCLTLLDPMTAAHQAPLSMGFSRQEYWSGVPLPSLHLLTNNIYLYRKINMRSFMVISGNVQNSEKFNLSYTQVLS